MVAVGQTEDGQALFKSKQSFPPQLDHQGPYYTGFRSDAHLDYNIFECVAWKLWGERTLESERHIESGPNRSVHTLA